MYIVRHSAEVLPLLGYIMLDTVWLLLDNYTIKDRASIGVDIGAGSEEYANKLLFMDKSGPVLGKKAYVNSKLSTGGSWHFDIKYHGPGAYAMLHFSLPKVHHGDNFYGAGRDGSKAALDMIEKDMLGQFGIKVDLLKARLSRVDMNYNIELDKPFSNYVHLLQALTKSLLALDEDIGTYVYRTGSKRRLTVIYDKIKEMAQHIDDLSKYPAHVMRIEPRLQKAQTVKAALDIETMGQLLEKDGYNAAKVYMLDTIHKKVFNYTPGGMKQLMVDSLIEQARQFEGPRNAWDNFIKALGMKALIEGGGVDVAKMVAKSMAKNDRSYRARRDDIDKVSTDFDIQVVDLESLYKELKDKIPPAMVA